MPPSRATFPAVQAAFHVERYAVYDEFAAGGMATVHFARLNGAHGFRRTVAVKRLLPHLTRDQDFALMLIDEARLASRVRHHNVVSTLDVVQTAHELLLVMEYVHGESLAKLTRWSAERHEPIPIAIAAAIVSDALHGLHAAHEATDEQGGLLGLVHRDVSPQNVLVGLDGITRIADFGVAKAAGRAHSTRDGAVKGKLAYMAPEQLSGGEVSRASDVFAAAVVLWEVLTGARLFAGKNHAETVFKVMSAPIPPPSTRRAALPPALDTIVLRGLERDPARRFASAREMALALERAAPSVRPSEIASWVERVVGERLAQRARTLTAIERDGESQTQAHTALHERRAPSDPWHALASTVGSPREEPRAATAQPPEGETGTHRKEATSQRSLAQIEPGLLSGTRAAPGATDRRAARRTLIGGSLIALLSLVSVVAWTLLSRRAPAPSTAPSDQAQRADEAAPTDQRGSSVTPRVAPVSLLSVPAPVVDAAVSTRAEQVPAANDRAAPPNDKRRLRAARKSSSACDPPYSIDPAGRVLFKVECM